MIVGLTGGMGCGKSTAARIFEEFGFYRVDSDALVRDRVLKMPNVIKSAQERFGSGVIDAHGQINRASLAKTLFANESQLHAWEDLVLPYVYELWRELFEHSPQADWIVEAPLLYEKGLENWFDFVVCVASSSSVQYARLAERGVSHTLAEQRISKQLPLAQKIEKADFVLSNDGSTDFLRDQIRHLTARLAVRA